MPYTLRSTASLTSVSARYYFFCGVRTTVAPALLTFFLLTFLAPAFLVTAFLVTAFLVATFFVPTFFLVAVLPAFLLALRFVAMINLRVSPNSDGFQF